MLKLLLKIFLTLLLLFCGWLAVVLSEWLPPETEAQRRALQLLEAEPANVGGERNVFAALWLSACDRTRWRSRSSAGAHGLRHCCAMKSRRPSPNPDRSMRKCRPCGRSWVESANPTNRRRESLMQTASPARARRVPCGSC